jgi:hypothetical protein
VWRGLAWPGDNDCPVALAAAAAVGACGVFTPFAVSCSLELATHPCNGAFLPVTIQVMSRWRRVCVPCTAQVSTS